MNLAVITGADGGMGMEITRAVATAGYQVIMACRDPQAAERMVRLRKVNGPKVTGVNNLDSIVMSYEL